MNDANMGQYFQKMFQLLGANYFGSLLIVMEPVSMNSTGGVDLTIKKTLQISAATPPFNGNQLPFLCPSGMRCQTLAVS